MIIEELEAAGPVRGVSLLFERTRLGQLTADEFTQGFQFLVLRVLEGVDDMEDQELLFEQLKTLPMDSIPCC